MNLSLEKTQI